MASQPDYTGYHRDSGPAALPQTYLRYSSSSVAATATMSPLKTKPDTASQRPPPPSANHVPPPTKSERLLYNLTDILDENGIPLLHMTDKFKEVISREDPNLQDLHQHVIDSGVTASSDAQGLPALDKVMKSVEPNEFERKNSMHLPLAPGTSRLPAPQYRKQSHADLEISAATIRAFFAQGWIYKCKSPTMAPIHLVPKPPKAGINPATGKPYPARRRMTIDYSRTNKCFQIEAARIPDVNETIQSLRRIAGESQRQFNATANKTLAGWMEDSQLGKMADIMRIITGKWHGECGERAYQRQHPRRSHTDLEYRISTYGPHISP